MPSALQQLPCARAVGCQGARVSGVGMWLSPTPCAASCIPDSTRQRLCCPSPFQRFLRAIRTAAAAPESSVKYSKVRYGRSVRKAMGLQYGAVNRDDRARVNVGKREWGTALMKQRRPAKMKSSFLSLFRSLSVLIHRDFAYCLVRVCRFVRGFYCDCFRSGR